MADYDLVVRGGTIVDGSGGAPFAGDIAIRGDRIVAVGDCPGTAAETVDASGKFVTPGFVDVHTHYDGQAIWSEELSPSSSHGVTTVVMGNCGVGFAPCRKEDHATLIKVMEGVEDIPGVVMAEGLPWDWETFPEYLDALDSRRRDIDVAAYLPHSPLRVYAMGARGAQREPATAEDLARMQSIAREAMEAGALGFATSRLMIHKTMDGQHIPSFEADNAELVAIAQALKDTGKGVVQMVLNLYSGWDAELSHLIKVVESSGRPATFTYAVANTGPVTPDTDLALVNAANAAGAKISPQILPRPIGIVAGFDLSTHPFCLCPSYLPIATLPLEQQLEHLRDPEFRARLIAEVPEEGHPLAQLSRNWDWLFPLSDPPNYEPAPETSVGAQARAQGRSPEDVAMDLLMNGGDGQGMLYNALGNFNNGKLDALYDLMQRDDVVLGLGDGGAHYGAICDASYPTFLLTYWTRDRDGPRLDWAKAIRALSATPAEAVGLHDRGRLAPGYKADLNVIDAQRLALHRPVVKRDLPGGGRRLDQGATGFAATVVSGQVIRRDDRPTGARPGRLVRGSQAVAA
ncbi:N-acyl-D-amino-acid deacylase family protein [Novosphingobium arvoryzae]|uniref:Amidohydrolase n=1 Tax=Novosphingobium arvoryzae TaxID=1256514 RepID=A0A918VH81_9SPHN|nr:amidohydrolase family protein [Novosphingobium arvoryzae]GGZ97496.1 amidohydrolase [Novosphingobium arvoryzae]